MGRTPPDDPELNRRYYVTDLSYPEWVRARDDLLSMTEQQLAAPTTGGFPAATHRVGDWRTPGRSGAVTAMLIAGVIATELCWVTIAPAPSHNGVWYPERISPHWTLPDPPGPPPSIGRPRRPNGDWDYEPWRASRPYPWLASREELLGVDRTLSEAEACIVTG